MFKKIIFTVLIPLSVLSAVSETDVSGSDFSPVGSPVAGRRVSKPATALSPFEQRQKKIESAVLRLKIKDEEAADAIRGCFQMIPDLLWDKVTGSVALFAGNLRKLTKDHYETALEPFVYGLTDVALRFQERPKILESIIAESALQFSQKLDLKKAEGAPSPKRVSRGIKKEVISAEFFPKLLISVTSSILDRDQMIPETFTGEWGKALASFYEEGSRELVLAASQSVREENKAWYEHLTAVTPNPDFELFELLRGCPDHSRPWVRRMIKLYASDRIPLNSLKMTKWFLIIPETFHEAIAAIFETFFNKDFAKNPDSQARMVHLFMKKASDPKVAYISHFVNIIGFLEQNLTGELAERLVGKLTEPGWGHVEKEIQENPEILSTSSDLDRLFREGVEEARRTEEV